MLLAANLLQPIVDALGVVLTAFHSVIPNYGWALIVLAFVVRALMWPLTNMQIRSMAEMQKVQPLIKQLQAKHKNDPQKLQQEQMALFKEHKVNPLAGCLPMLIPLPILIGLFWAINGRIDQMKTEHWLWIGSPISHALPSFFATSLAVPDIFLLILYVISMYFTVRYGSPPSQDAQQAQTQKIMAFISPAMIAYFGFRYKWASALYIYWLAMNVFTVAQQIYMYRKHGLMGGGAGAPAAAPIDVTPVKSGNGKKALKNGAGTAAGDGDTKRYDRAKKRAGRK